MLGGFMGCKGDAYSSKDALGTEEARKFHQFQCHQFQKQSVDFLFAGIMPEIHEATGMALAMAETGIPYIISFMIRKDGCLLDGTSISDAIALIDDAVETPPVCYMTNCVHPANLRQALQSDRNYNRPELKRFKGIQANASALSPEELNNCGILKQDDFGAMINEMQNLYDTYKLKIFGGCCGTNDVFLNDLASVLENNR
jgi:S-methylmethionine-dependent homocysteine/selenocysteine methylase